jgi:hypothetical protein
MVVALGAHKLQQQNKGEGLRLWRKMMADGPPVFRLPIAQPCLAAAQATRAMFGAEGTTEFSG